MSLGLCTWASREHKYSHPGCALGHLGIKILSSRVVLRGVWGTQILSMGSALAHLGVTILSSRVCTWASGNNRTVIQGCPQGRLGIPKSVTCGVHWGIWLSKYSHPGLSSEASGEHKEYHLGSALGHLEVTILSSAVVF